jgi:hypothetical protein
VIARRQQQHNSSAQRSKNGNMLEEPLRGTSRLLVMALYLMMTWSRKKSIL